VRELGASLSPRPGTGGGVHLVTRIDGSSSARQLLAAVRTTTTWGAGLGLVGLRLGGKWRRDGPAFGPEEEKNKQLFPISVFCFQSPFTLL
jgi:hypothetical protein